MNFDVDIGWAPDWVKDMKEKILSGDLSDPHIKELLAVPSADRQSISIINFTQFTRLLYTGEVGVSNDNNIIFHFFHVGEFPKNFEDIMGDAFIEVFKFEERLQAAYAEELNSWAVRVLGYGNNPSINMLCTRLLDVLDKKLAPT